MKLYVVETTEKGQLCGIAARNITVYKDLQKAQSWAVALVVNNSTKVRYRVDIAFDKFLDQTMKAYDKTEGNAETANALAYITKIKIEKS